MTSDASLPTSGDISIIDPDPELVREVYARFGAAYFYSECLHRNLSTFYAIAPFDSRDGITNPRIDERLTEAYALTLGLLVDAVQRWLPSVLYTRLRQAIEIRNFLAHQFWFQRCHMLNSNLGALTLIAELESIRAFFDDLDQECTTLVTERRRTLGVRDDAIDHALQVVAKGADCQTRPTRKRLTKRETLRKVWDVPVGDGMTTLIFELEDGSLWQLSDCGLGWTSHEAVGDRWIENPAIRPYLPVALNPRPGASGSWRYDLILGGRTRLSVRLSSRCTNAFEWELRSASGQRITGGGSPSECA